MKSDAVPLAFLVLLVFLSMLGPLTLNILMPSLPGMVESLKAPKESVQLALSLYLVGIAVSQLFLGPLADRYGRRPVILVALALYIVASLAAWRAPDVETLVVARIVQSFGAAAGISLGRTMIRDVYQDDRAASMIGYVTMGMVIAPMLAPSLGAFIDDSFGWRAILLFCGLLGILMIAVAAIRLPETRPAALQAATGRQVMERTLLLCINRRYMGYWGASAFCSAIFFGFLGAAPYLMIDVLGRSKAEYGLWFISLSFGYMVGNFISGRTAMRLGVDYLVWLGNIGGILGSLLMLGFAFAGWLSPLTLFGPAMITSFANGLVLPNAIAGGIGVDPKAAGAGSGLMGFGQMGVGAIATYLGGHFATQSTMPLAILFIVCAFLALFSGWVSRQPSP